MHYIENLAINGASSELLNFSDVDFKSLIDPINKLAFGNEEGSFHHANTLALLMHGMWILKEVKIRQ